MNKKKLETLSLYRTNTDTNAYLIEVSLEDYSELFNGWDASPVRRKDLEPELLDYLEEAGTEIPIKQSIELVFYLPKDKRDAERDERSITTIQNNFKVVNQMIQKKIERNYRRLLVYVTLSLIFLVAAYLLRNVTTLSLLTNIMIEGFFIGGWFLLWEAFSLFFFDTHEYKIRQKIFKRFIDSKIIFKETGE
ncbi:MAG TPA: hypothetical protein PLJ98_04725 [Acholeplasmataceae bacterium]|jgi:hypothetical protein|nr:hypothetical protein [Acholeplasmataceae bacterium]